jgi:hypothetical protein
MKLRVMRRRRVPLLLLFVLMLTGESALAQPAQSESELFRARIDAAGLALGNYPRYRNLAPKYRQQLAEFVSGNLLFAILHELGHAAIDQMKLPVLGKAEDAADAFAATRLIKMGDDFSHRVLVEAAKGWFLSVRRDKKEGTEVNYYDAHGLDQQRAFQIVCFMVGADSVQFKDLANETKLPQDRQRSCAADYTGAANSWDSLLKPHLRAPDQPRTEIDVVYGEGKGRAEIAAQASRSILLLETVARHSGDKLAWPAPFTLEMESCGFPNASWDPPTSKLTLCYELAADFADLYREYDTASVAPVRKRKSKK